jgi:S-DNA-T family DNA segregation ATPase FtsK/SpoIIIE
MCNGSGLSDERDTYFNDAALLIVEKEKASIGMLQRNFKIGFNRAARIMDQLEEAGVVGPEEGTKPRIVMVKNKDELNLLLEKERK